MNQQIHECFQASIPHDTHYLPFNQTYEKSIGFSEHIRLNNASEITEEEYLKDVLIYKAINNVCGNSVIPEEIQANNSSCNQFLEVNCNNKPTFVPSKWAKPNKTHSDFRSNQQLKELTFGKAQNKSENARFPDLKMLESHTKQIEESIQNSSLASQQSFDTSVVDSQRKEEEWKKAKDAIIGLKRLIE